MKKILIIAACVCLVGSLCAYKYFKAHNDQGFAVVELFTSEGCSSCPPADKLLGKINKDYNGQPVYVLSFHVDYWDNAAWKDRFSNKQFSERQKQYDHLLHTDTYTPQAVINGEKEALGSDERALSKLMGDMLHADNKGKTLECTLSVDKGKLRVAYKTDAGQAGNLINVAMVQDNALDKVLGGENKGRTMEHVNIVRAFKTETVKRSGGDITLNISDDLKTGSLRVIAYTQNKDYLQVISASSSDIKYQ